MLHNYHISLLFRWSVNMNLVIVCDILGKKNNGTTIASYNLINSMKQKGHKVTVMCCDKEKEGEEGFIIVEQMDFGVFNKIVERNGVTIPRVNKKELLKAIIGSDLVHIMIPFPMGVRACKIAKRLGKSVTAGFHCQAELVTSHFGLMNIKTVNKLVYKNFYHNLYQYCDAIHYPTQFICDTFENIVGKTKSYIISNGVNKDVIAKKTFRPVELNNKFVILTTGRLCREKSHDILLKAIAKSKYNDRIQLIMAGQGPLISKIEKYASKHLKNKPIIKYFTREEMISLLNYADLYCHPAEVELEGIACLEAIVCGLVPIVSDSDRSATKGFALTEANIFKNRNYNELARKIDFFIENLDEKEKLKQKYLEFGHCFDQDECMNKMEKMFLDVLNKKLK